MKITTAQLRNIIREEVKKAKFEKFIRESVRNELINEGFLDKVKGVFGKGLQVDVRGLINGIKLFQSEFEHFRGFDVRKSKPKTSQQFLMKQIYDSTFKLPFPGQEGKNINLGLLFNDKGFAAKDVSEKIEIAAKKHADGRLDDEKFKDEVVKLTGVPAKFWGEFTDFAEAVIGDSRKKYEDSSESENKRLDKMKNLGNKELEDAIKFAREFANKNGLSMSDPRVKKQVSDNFGAEREGRYSKWIAHNLNVT